MVTDDNGPVVMRHKTKPRLKLTLFCRKAISKMSFVSSHFLCEKSCSAIAMTMIVIAFSSRSSYLWSGVWVFMACVVLGGETGVSGPSAVRNSPGI